MLSERGFVFFQDPEERGWVCAHVWFCRVTRCKVSTRIRLALPEEELVKAWSLAEPCRWCCGPSLAVPVLENSPATASLCVRSVARCSAPVRELGSTQGFSVGTAAKWGFNLYSCASKTASAWGSCRAAGRGPHSLWYRTGIVPQAVNGRPEAPLGLQ